MPVTIAMLEAFIEKPQSEAGPWAKMKTLSED
jgi:hypothetical protein